MSEIDIILALQGLSTFLIGVVLWRERQRRMTSRIRR
jgi:hypothetical protein